MLDLLYSDELNELDEWTRQEALQQEVAQSDDDAAEFAELQAMLGRIRQEEHGEDVPESVHSAIMDAARRHAAESTSRSAQAVERAPRTAHAARAASPDRGDRGDRKKSLWSRVVFGTGGQIALVATVMLLAGVLFVATNANHPTRKFHAANSAVTSDVTFHSSPASDFAANQVFEDTPIFEDSPAEEVEVEQKAIATGPAGNVRAEQDKAAPGFAATSTGSGRAGRKSDIGPIALLDDVADQPQPRSRAAQEPMRRRKSRRAKKPRSIPQAASKAEAGIAPRAEPEMKRRLFEATKGAPAAARAAAPSDAELAESEPPQQKQKQQRKSGLGAIEESFASAHYDEVIVRVDAYMKQESATADGKARALEFKARAQEAGGDQGGALNTYEQLHQRFPTYRADEMEREIERLRRAQTKMMRRSATKPMLDSAEPASAAPRAPAEAGEAPVVPSSLDSTY
jgi:hypothetical protein